MRAMRSAGCLTYQRRRVFGDNAAKALIELDAVCASARYQLVQTRNPDESFESAREELRAGNSNARRLGYAWVTTQLISRCGLAPPRPFRRP